MSIPITYSSLFQKIQDYNERNDPSFVNNIPTFIFLAQLRINADLKTLLKETVSTGSLTPNQQIFLKPNDWRQTVSFNIGIGDLYETVFPLQSRTQDFIRIFWPDVTAIDQPLYYSDYGNKGILIAPTPDLPYVFEFSYLGNQQFLSDSVQTNSITDYCPNLLLMASLLEANIFTKDSDMEAAYKARYAELVQPLLSEDQNRKQTRFSVPSRD